VEFTVYLMNSVYAAAASSQGDIVVSGVVMKEWQRTPKLLVQEWCQKQKRPRPNYNQHRGGGGGGSTSSDSGTGSVRCWLTLPDPKQPDTRSLRFLTQQGFSSIQEAEQASALLALHHIGPGLPRERVLPEPYATMWLQLAGWSDSSATSSSVSSSDGKKEKKEKKEKQPAAWRVAKAEEEARAEAVRLQQEQEKEVCGGGQN
jgi:hypothetical protein